MRKKKKKKMMMMMMMMMMIEWRIKWNLCDARINISEVILASLSSL